VIRVPAGFFRAEGMIKNVNTIEEYRGIDKGGMLQQAGRTVSPPQYCEWMAIAHNSLRYGTL
jgi:Ubiquitin-like modifier-activating enzyme ATG7 N-terminus